MQIKTVWGWCWSSKSNRIIGKDCAVFDINDKQIGSVYTGYALGKGTSLKTDRFAIMDIDLLVEEPHSLRFEILDRKALKDLKFHIHYMDEGTRDEVEGLCDNWDYSITYPMERAEPMIRGVFAAIDYE